MAKIPEHIVKRISATASIEEVVADFVRLRKIGVRYTGICPFHDDRHDGNFIVYPKDNCYRCFTCDAKGDAVRFLMEKERMSFPDAIRWLGKKYNIETDNVPFDYSPPPPPPPPPPRPTLILPREMVAKRMHTDGDTLCSWIRSQPWDASQRERIGKVLHEYCVGHATITQNSVKHDFTVFWQIDEQGHPRTAHYMKYNCDGHRVKREQDRYNTDWFHSLLERRGYRQIYDPESMEVRQCFFGLHLLRRYPGAAVSIVESEKTALLMAIAYGNSSDNIWMASCGASNLTKERLRPIMEEHRQISLYPDRDGVNKWSIQGKRLNYDLLTIQTKEVLDWWQPQDGQKADIADIVLRMISG